QSNHSTVASTDSVPGGERKPRRRSMAANYTAWMAWCSLSPPFRDGDVTQGGTNARSTFRVVPCRDAGRHHGARAESSCAWTVDVRHGRMRPRLDDLRRPEGHDPGPRLDHQRYGGIADVRNHLRHLELRRGGLLQLRGEDLHRRESR